MLHPSLFGEFNCSLSRVLLIALRRAPSEYSTVYMYTKKMVCEHKYNRNRVFLLLFRSIFHTLRCRLRQNLCTFYFYVLFILIQFQQAEDIVFYCWGSICVLGCYSRYAACAFLFITFSCFNASAPLLTMHFVRESSGLFLYFFSSAVSSEQTWKLYVRTCIND